MKVLVVTGSMGSGKTTMIGELSDLLASRGIAHAAIDIDAFGNAHDPLDAIDLAAVAYRNVAAAVGNYAARGVSTFVLAGAIETAAELTQLQEAVGTTDVVVCRLGAPIAVMQDRIRRREPGMWQQKYVDRVAMLEATLDRAGLEDFAVANDGSRPITSVAEEILQRAGWLQAN
jgi:predicted kinase